MNELQIFDSPKFGEIRVIVRENEPWFVASDACRILEIGDISKAVSRLDDDEKGTSSIPTPGGVQNMLTVNEPGLYSLVLGSRKPEAKEFKRWLTHEVLPAIRKHGMYATDTVIEQVLQNPDFGIKLLIELKEERDKRKELELLNDQKEQIIHELQPKASYYDLILQSKSVLSISKIAKDYGMTANEMNKLLHSLGVQYKEGSVWLLYKKYSPCGYTQSKTHIVNDVALSFHTYWTQKGRIFIYNLLKNKCGILPLIEREENKKSVR